MPGNRKKIKGWLWSYSFILPSLLFIFVFLIVPLGYTFYLSFFQVDFESSRYIGLDNYSQLFHDPLFLKTFVNTFYYVLFIVPCTIVFSLIAAVFVQGFHAFSKGFFRLVFYLPVVSTPVVLTLVWAWMYNPSFGIISYFSKRLGLGTIEVFGRQDSAIVAISIVALTYMVGQPIILYMSAIDGVSKELFEAAAIDGANPLQTFFKITLPSISHTTLLIVITTTISIFQIFVVIHLLTGGGPFHATESLVYSIYRKAFVEYELGAASGQSVILFFIILIIALFQFKLLKSRLD